MPARAASAEPVRRALAAAGGRERLERVKALNWTGTARVVIPGRALSLGVETRIEPFRTARSDSWILTEGRASTRTMVIDRSRGYAIRNGKESPLPDAIVAQERDQFGMYGYMLIALAPAVGVEDYLIRATRADYPPADLHIDDRGRLTAADYVITSDDGKSPPVSERFTFSGTVTDKGVRWPKRIAIAQAGKAYFDLTIDTFSVELA